MSSVDIKVGDHVVITGSHGSDVRLRTVQKVTKTTITVDGDRYSLSTGRLFGSSPWSGSHFRVYVPERDNSALERARLQRRFKHARKALQELTVTKDNVTRIETLLEELNNVQPD